MLDINLKKDEMFYAEQFSKMIQCPTITRNGREPFAKLREVMKTNCPLFWEKCELFQLEEDALLFRLKGKSSDKPVVLMAHQDVVPVVEEDWDEPPFSGNIHDGKIWGRGSMDDKNCVYITMRAAEELLEDGFVPEQDIYFSYSDSEERFGYGVAAAKKWFEEHNVKPNMVLDEGGSLVEPLIPKFMDRNCAMIGCLEKGYMDVKFVAKSDGGHSSTPPKNTPIERLSKLVNYCMSHKLFKVKALPLTTVMLKGAASAMKSPYKGLLNQTWLSKFFLKHFAGKINYKLDAMTRTTIVFTMSQGSVAPNVIPQEAYVLANLRLMPYDRMDDVKAKLEKIAKKFDCECEYTIDCRNACNPIDTTTEEFKMFTDSLEAVFPGIAIVPYIMTGGTDCRVMQELCDNAYRCAPCFLTMEQMNTMHAANENINISSILGGVKFFKYFMQIYK